MKKFLMLTIIGILAVLIPSIAFAASNWHCCIEPSCTECSEDMLGCNCELKEKLGMKVCDECAAHGCEAHDAEEMHSGAEEISSMHSGVVACNAD